ncbi:fimbria/pilus outer membrane usher protein [Citrobacter portucalensis]|uniref:fimbria/pilus outer membrane usher protein n=1 Tax=Citrobacter portucalensis TaxID=1639133 RepID=UPI001F47AFF7|nr:fimbria/pilus outer membrane usher protein [Citrobacter portucalensis]MCE9762193.1 fimbrial biogenesis outer membrane usher protein [Citrobacter portucalensis]
MRPINNYHEILSLKLSAIAAALMLCSPFCIAESQVADDEFNIDALRFDSPIDSAEAIRTFLDDNALAPGVYLSSVYFNNHFVEKKNVTYVLNEAHTALIPVLKKSELAAYGVNVSKMPLMKTMSDDATVDDIGRYIEEASWTFSTQQQRLDIRVPQVAVNQEVQGYIDPDNWDDGIPAALLGYYYSGSKTHYSSQGSSTQNYLSLNSGLNLGPWRIRNNGNYQSGDGWENISTYIQRDIKRLRSQLTLGDSSTAGDIFDSLPIRGIRLQTDTAMLPYSQQGFAPVIRGIAKSDAKVTIKQNGYTLYQTYVSAGAFEITDVPQVSSGSDFDITITEADGSERSFVQTSSSLPIMQRQGALQYSVAAGHYQNNDTSEDPNLVEAQLIYGLPYGFTVYSGVLGSDFYRSAALGFGIDLHDFGALSFDATTARSEVADNVWQGMSYRAQYAKNIDTTNTNLTLASYRYSTRNFYTFTETLNNRTNDIDDDSFYAYRNTNNRRSRFQVNISQSLNELGSFYLSGYQQDYWGLAGYERTVSVGYNQNWERIRFMLNYSLTQTPTSHRDEQVSFTVSIPLDKWLPSAWANYTYTDNRHRSQQHLIGISGTALQDDNLNYNLQQSWGNNGMGENGSMNATWQGSFGSVSGGYNYDNNSRQVNYKLQGGIIGHAGGFTLAQSLPETVTLVDADDGPDIKVENSTGVYTDSYGYAVIPYASPYRTNNIILNTASNPQVDIEEPVKQVIPSRGAVTLATFSARTGIRVLLTLQHNGNNVPFGALAALAGENEKNYASIVGDNGQVYLTGVSAGDRVMVKWGEKATQQCTAQIAIPADELTNKAVAILAAECK